MGTGGTLSGVASYLRKRDPSIKIALTDPEGAAMVSYFQTGELQSQGSSISEGIGQGRVTGNMQGLELDMCFEIPDKDMVPVLQDIQMYDGLCVGTSSGVNVAGAIRVAREMGPGHNIVTVLCDSASRYASKQYNPNFLNTKGLPVPSWLQEDTVDDIGLDEAIKKALQ